MFGKWHLGMPTRDVKKPTPAEHGFDYWFGMNSGAHPSHKDPVNFLRNRRPLGKIEGYSCHILVDEAIAMAVMYTANHMDVKAIIALTESGSTTRWMSRVRSDIPIYAMTPYEATSRRVALYRGVYSVEFEIAETDRDKLYAAIFEKLLSKKLVEKDDLVIFTKGDLKGVSGNTNAMKLLQVKA